MSVFESLAIALRWLFYLASSYLWAGGVVLLLTRRITPHLWGGGLAALLFAAAALMLDRQAFAVTSSPLLFHGGMVLAFIALQLVAWRYLYFFRDPSREIADAAAVSPADGFIAYVRRLEAGEVPLAIKRGRAIPLAELVGQESGLEVAPGSWLVGIFMTPVSVHVNRAPIAGRIAARRYLPARSIAGMARTQLRLMLGLAPYERGAEYLLRNEREVLRIEGEMAVHVVRIADPYVRSIETWKAEGERVGQGERIGMIRMGSQCDVILPPQIGGRPLRICVEEGQYVYSGKTALAEVS